MKVLLLYDYPPPPGGLATQGELLHQGLRQLGVDAHAVHQGADCEKEWYYRWFRPDVVIGVGFWGLTPNLVMHPRAHGMLPVPWLVADGFVANYRDELNSLPLVLATSNWVKDVYVRDGIREEIIEVLPVGCDTDNFVPRSQQEPLVATVRETLGVAPDKLMLLVVGGDAASKGGQEVLRALARLGEAAGDWIYVCKVWPQERTRVQNALDRELAAQLGVEDRLTHVLGIASRHYMPYLMAACDIYAAPSRLEGFGMPHVEANACARPVVGIKAMALLDTQVHGETALLADVGEEVFVSEAVFGPDAGFEPGHRIEFGFPRIAGYRADVDDLARQLGALIADPDLRRRLGEAGRRRAVERYDYRVVARQLVDLLGRRLGIT